MRQTHLRHLSELPLPELLPEVQPVSGELGSGDVLAGQRVHGQSGNGVHVGAGDALKAHDVSLCVVWGPAAEALVRRALGHVRLRVAPAACWTRVRPGLVHIRFRP